MNKKRQKNKGITLIALVITIIVLLILAGVTIATLTGDNGILTKATEAKLENEYASVKEGIGLAVSEYNTIKYAGEEQTDEFLSWLQSKGYTDTNNTVNTQNLLNQTLSTGNGETTGTKDVYKIEETEENVYVLVYYDEDGNRKELSTFTLDSSDSLEETDESYFVITDDGTISLKDYDEYYDNVKEWTIENLVIPKKVNGIEVKKIGDRMFYTGVLGYSNISQNLKTVVIPDTVIEIGNSAFYNCYELNKIIIPDSVTQIGTYAFYGCGLQDIDLPNQLTAIEDGVFCGSDIANIIIPSSVTSIGGWAFSSCTNLTNITIPDNVVSIGERAFSNCENLSNVTLPNGITEIGDYMFYECTNLTNITIPDNVVSIGEWAFSNCENLTNIILPDAITVIKSGTFSDCVRLEQIELPSNLKVIENFALSGCENLRNIDLPNQLTTIGNNAFSSSGFTSIILPSSVTSIGSNTFSRCNSLTSIIIPSTVKEMGQDVFWYWNSTQTIYIEFAENEIPDTWDSDWLRNCEAEVIYGYKPE